MDSTEESHCFRSWLQAEALVISATVNAINEHCIYTYCQSNHNTYILNASFKKESFTAAHSNVTQSPLGVFEREKTATHLNVWHTKPVPLPAAVYNYAESRLPHSLF